jgi:hypothetical protein
MATILFLGASPSDTTRLMLDREVREISQRLRATGRADRIRFVQEWAVRADDLQAHLLRHKPDVVHFSGHGSQAGHLLVEDADGNSVPLGSAALSNLFRILRRNVRCVVLNACFSGDQASAVARHIDCVVGMSAAVKAASTLAFAGAFYQALAFGESFLTAFELGCSQIQLQGLSQDDIPRLITREGIDPQTMRLMDTDGC